jgi:hypothetical protein
MGFSSAQTRRALAAADVDLTHHALALAFRLPRRSDDFAYEFVSGYTAKGVISFNQLKVRPADARQRNANQSFVYRWLGLRYIITVAQLFVFQPDGFHVIEIKNLLLISALSTSME